MQALTGLSGLSGMVEPTGSSGPTTLSRDTFTDTNGTALGSHTPDMGPSWTVVAGAVTIQSNRAHTTGTGQAVMDVSQADVTISVVVNLTSGAASGIIARYTDIGNYWFLELDQSAGALRIWEVNAGTFTQRASASVTVSAGTDYTLQFVLSGTNVSGTVNGGSSISYGSATFQQTATKHGLRLVFGSGTDADNWLATNP